MNSNLMSTLCVTQQISWLHFLLSTADIRVHSKVRSSMGVKLLNIMRNCQSNTMAGATRRYTPIIEKYFYVDVPNSIHALDKARTIPLKLSTSICTLLQKTARQHSIIPYQDAGGGNRSD